MLTILSVKFLSNFKSSGCLQNRNDHLGVSACNAGQFRAGHGRRIVILSLDESRGEGSDWSDTLRQRTGAQCDRKQDNAILSPDGCREGESESSQHAGDFALSGLCCSRLNYGSGLRPIGASPRPCEMSPLRGSIDRHPDPKSYPVGATSRRPFRDSTSTSRNVSVRFVNNTTGCFS